MSRDSNYKRSSRIVELPKASDRDIDLEVIQASSSGASSMSVGLYWDEVQGVIDTLTSGLAAHQKELTCDHVRVMTSSHLSDQEDYSNE